MEKINQIINKSIVIYGKKIIIVPDFVGELPAHEQYLYVEVMPATSDRPAIYIREQDILQAREKFPGTLVFGLWQIIFENDFISFSRDLQIIKINDDEGYYLYCENGKAMFSGIYKAGFIAADSDLELTDAFEISFSIDQVILPQASARLAVEIRSELKNFKKTSFLFLIAVGACFLFFGLFIDFSLSRFYGVKIEKHDLMKKNLDQVISEWNFMRAKKLADFPDDSMLMNRIASLWLIDKSFQTFNEQSFSKNEIKFTMKNWSKKYNDEVHWLDATLSSSGVWEVSVQKK